MPTPSHRPRKRFGQNFLVDRRAVRRIAAAACEGPDVPLLEIGPGRGALTAALLDIGRSVTAVEIDRDLAARLEADLGPRGLSVVRDSILDIELRALAATLHGGVAGRPIAIVGNLPYNISKPIAMRLVDHHDVIDRAVVMFQREVADRLTAEPGTRAYGPLTILAGLTYDIVRLFDLPPAAFRPRPAVHSTVTRWSPRRPAAVSDDARPALRRCLAACFASRRRTIRNNVRHALGGSDADIAARLEAAAIDPRARAETVAPGNFVALASTWPQPA